jgi:hypothetical protein
MLSLGHPSGGEVFGVRGFVLGTMVLVMLIATACGSTGNYQGNSSQDSSDTEASTTPDDIEAQTTQQQSKSDAPSEQTLSIGEATTFRLGDKVTVYEYASPVQSDNQLIQPKAGNQFAIIDVMGCTGSEPGPKSDQMTFGPFLFALQMLDNTRIQPMALSPVEPALTTADIPLGECLRGHVGFEVPQGQTPSYVLLTDPPTKWALE